MANKAALGQESLTGAESEGGGPAGEGRADRGGGRGCGPSAGGVDGGHGARWADLLLPLRHQGKAVGAPPHRGSGRTRRAAEHKR